MGTRCYSQMKIKDIRGCASADEYVRLKLSEYEAEEKSFKTLFRFMFSESNNIMAESTDGYRIKKITYAQFKTNILAKAASLKESLSGVERGSLVGLYMSNSVEWLELFWSALICGYDLLIMNTRLPDEILEKAIRDHNVRAVISDEKHFSVPTVLSETVLPSEHPLDASDDFGSRIIFMSSGTTENVKLCSYTGENFYYQIKDSVNIVKTCPGVKSHYNGDLKQLVLLPFCHVFGFIAVYLWFGFFARTFVFPKDLNPATIQNTIKKHKVTHVFAVPLVWENVYKAAIGKIKSRSAATYKRFRFFHAITLRTGRLGNLIARSAFRELREGLFGDSVQFIVSGGSHIKKEVLEFFNGIGYHTANGYGMTEIGITSVEKSRRKSILCSGSIGAPFGNTFYKISEDGELLVKGKTRACEIIQGDQIQTTDYDGWFATNDLASYRKGRYYLNGRRDDLIISETGENINPVIAEKSISAQLVERLCIFKQANGTVTLLASVPGCFSEKRISEIYKELTRSVERSGLLGEIKTICITNQALVKDGEIKLNRRHLAKRFEAGEFRIISRERVEEDIHEMLSELENEVIACFAEVLNLDATQIGTDQSFFTDLGGTSLDYFALHSLIKQRMGVDIITAGGQTLCTVEEICQHIKGT